LQRQRAADRAEHKADKKERPQEAPFLTAFARLDKGTASGKPVAAQIIINTFLLS
jgi:hypothetical protein